MQQSKLSENSSPGCKKIWHSLPAPPHVTRNVAQNTTPSFRISGEGSGHETRMHTSQNLLLVIIHAKVLGCIHTVFLICSNHALLYFMHTFLQVSSRLSHNGLRQDSHLWNSLLMRWGHWVLRILHMTDATSFSMTKMERCSLMESKCRYWLGRAWASSTLVSRIGIFIYVYILLLFSVVRRSVNACSHSFNAKQCACQVHVWT